MDTRSSHISTACALPCSVVKWKSPTEELVGMAKVAQHFIYTGASVESRMRFVAPSLVWALQMQQAAQSVGLQTCVLAPCSRVSAHTQAALERLAALASPLTASTSAPDDEGFVAGETVSEVERDFVQRYQDARGFTLLRATGLRACTELQGALQHVQGNEDAAQLYSLITQQLSHPTPPPNTESVPIVSFQQDGEAVDYVFALGCVQGLVPAPGWGDAQSAQALFGRTLKRAKKQAFISYFTRVDARVATQAHLVFSRTKQEDGMCVAMTKPTTLLDAWANGSVTTEGGQAFLRRFGLN